MPAHIVLNPTYPEITNTITHIAITYITDSGSAIINTPNNVPAPFPPLKL